MSAYTSGPWVADVSANDKGGWDAPCQHVVIGNGSVIVSFYDTSYEDFPEDQENVANARLMASAPELLEALQAIVASLSEHDDEGMVEHAPQMISARSAIAKATGAQS